MFRKWITQCLNGNYFLLVFFLKIGYLIILDFTFQHCFDMRLFFYNQRSFSHDFEFAISVFRREHNIPEYMPEYA